MPINITSNLGYMGLDSWILANIIQLGTFDFCRTFLNKDNDPCGRFFDQMTQAARSGQANIAEGCGRRQTSTETELKLLDVARSSLNELAGDYMFILMSRGEACWATDDQRHTIISEFRLTPTQYGKDYLHDAMVHILAQKSRLDQWLKSRDVSIVANTLLILTMRVIRMLDKQIAKNLENFRQQGGFAENLTQERLNAKREQAVTEGSPTCTACGKPMFLKSVMRGSRQGQQFWSCSDYPRCKGTRPLAY